MKCDTVQHVIVEYDEGGLCVADELCVDIHLVQCPDCREELADLGAFQGIFSRGLTHPEPRNHLRDLLSCLDSADAPSSSRLRFVKGKRFPERAIFRFSVAVTLSVLLLCGGSLGWGKDFLPFFQLPIVEAESGLPVPETWRPWMRRNNAIGNGETLEMILSQGGSALPW